MQAWRKYLQGIGGTAQERGGESPRAVLGSYHGKSTA